MPLSHVDRISNAAATVYLLHKCSSQLLLSTAALRVKVLVIDPAGKKVGSKVQCCTYSHLCIVVIRSAARHNERLLGTTIKSQL